MTIPIDQSSSRDERLTRELEQCIRERLQTDLVGFARIGKFEGAPRGRHPTDLLPGANSAITFAVAWPAIRDPEADVVPMTKLQDTAFHVACRLEEQQYQVLPIPTLPVPDRAADWGRGTRPVPGRSAFSHRHAAVAAGLGELGLNGLFVAPRYGPNVRLSSVITSAKLVPSSPYEEQLCAGEQCARCIRVCPRDAYGGPLAYVVAGRQIVQCAFLREHCEEAGVYCVECLAACPVGA